MLNKVNCVVKQSTVLFLAVLGVFFVCAGSYFGFKIIPDYVTSKMWEMKVLRNSTEQWDMFLKVPFPFAFKVYVFDIQNPNDILQGTKPIVKERGPYIYKEFKYNTDIEWNASRISFYQNRRFYFDRKASMGYDDEDFITTLNTPYLNILYKIQDQQPGALGMIADALPAMFGEFNDLFIKVKLRDYLFDGLKICEDGGKAGGFVAGMVCKQIAAKLSEAPAMRMIDNTILFATMHYKNTTRVGKFTIESGIDNTPETAVLKEFEESENISVWEEHSTCNKVGGVTTVFPVSIDKSMVFEAFSADVCRTMALEYQREETIKDILGYRFVAKNNSFNYSVPENSCFCLNTTKTLSEEPACAKDGVMDLSICTGGPVFLSFPHLLYADKEYSSTLEGLHPDPDEHETFVTLDPVSGTPLMLAQRVQFNMFTRPLEGFSVMENVSKALIPLFWLEESTTLEDKYTDMLKNQLFKNLRIINIVKWVVIGSGAGCVLLALFLLVYVEEP